MYFIIFIILLLFLIKLLSPNIKGTIGESKVSSILNTLQEPEYIVLNDILIQQNGFSTQIDHIVLSVYGIFVLETKNYKGWIFGSEFSENWTKNLYGNKFTFRNPILQNKGHINALKHLLSIYDDSRYISIIAFSNKGNLKFHDIKNVVYFSGIIKLIKEYNFKVFTEDQILTFKKIILNSNVDKTFSNITSHIKSSKEKQHSNEVKIHNNICPRCGKKLVIRNGKYGRFYGCSNYPHCRFTKPYK